MIDGVPAADGIGTWFFPEEMSQGHYCPWPRDYVPTADEDEKLAGFGLVKTADRDIWLGLPVYEGRVDARHCVLNARLVFKEGEPVVQWRLRAGGGWNTVLAENVTPVAAVVEAIVDGSTGMNAERPEDVMQTAWGSLRGFTWRK